MTRVQRRFRRRLQTVEGSPSYFHIESTGESGLVADETGTSPVHCNITGWVKTKDPESRATFYYNTATGESRCEPPGAVADTPIASSQAGGEDSSGGELETDTIDADGGIMDIELCDIFTGTSDGTIDACGGPNESGVYGLGSVNPMHQGA